MPPAVSAPPSQNVKDLAARHSHAPVELHPEAAASESRNFIVLALYLIAMRTGWIFKTESIIMPAVLDTIDPSGSLRGWLPLLNRFGQSVPPLLMARRIKVLPRKKWSLVTTTMSMAAVFFVLTLLWIRYAEPPASWMPIAYLVMYGLFFAYLGVNQLSFGTLQGKLIATTHRGRLLLLSNVVGAITAIACALWLLPLWLRKDGGDFASIFGFSGLLFAISGVAALFLVEPRDAYDEPRASPLAMLGSAWKILKCDANFRLLAIVACMFGVSLTLFPHYQALGRDLLGQDFSSLLWWVIIQNIGTGIFSLPAGPIADWRGNRLVLQWTMLGLTCAPLLAIGCVYAGVWGGPLFNWVFLLVGLSPVAVKTFNNYTLEICEPADHPRYLGTLGLCMAIPMFFGPIFGFAIQRFGFEAPYLAIAALVLLGWFLSLWLIEPRKGRVHPAAPEPLET